MTDSSPSAESSPATARPQRSWLRFRLRTLLVVAPLVAIGLGLAIRHQYARYVEERAIQAVEELGGKLRRDAGGHITGVELPGKEIDDNKLRELVPHLRNLPDLRDLVLVSNAVTDDGVQRLADVPQLRTVYLAGTKVTPEGVARLRRQAPLLAVDMRSPHPTAARLAARDIYDHAILSLALSPRGTQILAGSGDGRLRVWNIDRREQVRSIAAHDEWTFAVAFHPRGRLLATAGGDHLIKLWSWPQLEEVGRFRGHNDDVHAAAFTPDGRRLVSAGDDWTVRIWDVASKTELHALEGHTGTIPGLAVSPDCRLAASASRDGTVRLWDIATGRAAGILRGHTADVMAVDFHPAGRELASASYDGSVIVWDVERQRQLRTLPGHRDWVFAVHYAPSGGALVSVAGDGVRKWDTVTGKLAWHAREPKNASHAIWLRGKGLAASSADGSITLWHIDDSQPLDRLWTAFTDDFLEPRKMAAE